MSKLVVHATWDDVPHLSRDAKKDLWNSIPAYQRKPRSKGIPQLGAGLIYPVDEEDYKVKLFTIPPHWPRGYGMDVGWNRTAALWAAHDRENDVRYLYHEHYRGEAEPVVHASAIQAPGAWVPGRIDPAARHRSQIDGQKLLELYQGLGLKLECAPNAVEAGIYQIWTLLSTGRLKVFEHLSNFFSEIRVYRRDEKGKIPEGQRDHLMAALRYFILAGIDWLVTAPAPPPDEPRTVVIDRSAQGLGWMS